MSKFGKFLVGIWLIFIIWLIFGVIEMDEEIGVKIFGIILVAGIFGYPLFLIVSIKKENTRQKEIERKRKIENEKKYEERQKAEKEWCDASPDEKRRIKYLSQPPPTNNELLQAILGAVQKPPTKGRHQR